MRKISRQTFVHDAQKLVDKTLNENEQFVIADGNKQATLIPFVLEEQFVEVEIELEDEIFNLIARAAHKSDVTFNVMFARILREQIARGEHHKLAKQLAKKSKKKEKKK